MNIVYAVPHELNGAVRQRVLGIARSLCLVDGVTVTILGPSGSFDDIDEQSQISYFETESRSGLGASRVAKTKWRLNLGRDTVKHLASRAERPDLLIVYGGGAMYMRRLQKWAKAAGVPAAADIVEWHEASHQPLGRFGPFAFEEWLTMTRVAPRFDGVIAISSFLRSHFESAGVRHVVTVPPTMDVAAMEWEAAPLGERQRLVYCGNPGRKDRLDLVIAALAAQDPAGERFELLVAGPDEPALCALTGRDSLPPGVSALGRLSHRECLDLVRSADWTPLIRSNHRFAQAGFPTKIAESMALGTPPLANLTSDLGSHLVDGENAIVVCSDSVNDVRRALAVAEGLSPSQRHDLSRQARSVAEHAFDHRSYVEALSTWVGRVLDSRRESNSSRVH